MSVRGHLAPVCVAPPGAVSIAGFRFDRPVATVTFAVIYLLVHAAIKLIAVIGILRKQLWAYPFSLITLGALVLYQIYSIIDKTSIGMILLTIFDVYILWMIWREYGMVKKSYSSEE